MKTAFADGYNTRLPDIEAKAVGEEYAQLSYLLRQFSTNDELPFC